MTHCHSYLIFLSLGKVAPCYMPYRIELVCFKDKTLKWEVLVIRCKRKPITRLLGRLGAQHLSCVLIWSWWRCLWIVATGFIVIDVPALLFFLSEVVEPFCVLLTLVYWNERSNFLPLKPNADCSSMNRILTAATQSWWWSNSSLSRCLMVRLSWLWQILTKYSNSLQIWFLSFRLLTLLEIHYKAVAFQTQWFG